MFEEFEGSGNNCVGMYVGGRERVYVCECVLVCVLYV